MENSEIIIKVIPLYFDPINNFISLCKFLLIRFQIKFRGEGINQNIFGINNNPRKVLTQFIEIFIIDVVGSKTENKFVIIFSFYFSLC
jgi:hypothetical protein